MSLGYSDAAPERSALAARPGPLVLEFGSNDCGICRAAAPLIASVLGEQRDLPHLRIQDGRGKVLGRSFGVKLWPTLVFLRDGNEVARVVRPQQAAEIHAALARLQTAD